MSTYARLWGLLLRRRATLLVALIGMAGAAAATGLFALLTGPALKLLFTGGTTPSWIASRMRFAGTAPTAAHLRIALPLALFAVAAARAAFGYLQTSRMAELCLRTVADLQEALHEALLSLPLSFFEGRHSGEVFARFTSDLGDVDRALTQGITYGLRDSFQLVALVSVSLALDWRLLVLGALTLPVGVFALARFGRALRHVSARLQERHAQLLSQAQDLLSGATVLQISRAQAAALRSEARAEEGFLAIGRRSAALRAAVTPSIELLAYLALALVMVGLRNVGPSLPPEKVVSFLGAVVLAYQPLKSISSNNQWILPGLTAAERLFALLDAPPAIADAPDAIDLFRNPGGSGSPGGAAVELAQVSVRYGERSVLGPLSLKVAAGEKVALVGRSGAGKSTLLHLLPRLLDPTDGTVRINGIDVRSATLRSLRSQIALVSQEVFLFDASVADNVALGHPHAPGALEAALRSAGAFDFVQALPEGLGTRLGERGQRLSGGQRQRLSLARALLKGAPLLLLDEAMSALDPPLEAAILEGLCSAAPDTTLLLVTHRLHSAARLDRVIVLGDGQVLEDGAPQALSRDGWFARALREQGEPAPAALVESAS